MMKRDTDLGQLAAKILVLRCDHWAVYGRTSVNLVMKLIIVIVLVSF